MSSQFQESERENAISLLQSSPSIFRGDKGNGKFMGKNRDFMLSDGKNNLFGQIQDKAIEYFKENHISWWGGKNITGHLLSSQVACINYLFAIREDQDAVLAIAKNISPDFTNVLPIESDRFSPAYIQFEAVSDHDYLNEGDPKRGSNCTSIDALILAVHKTGEIWLIPIEWKYTEFYGDTNKSKESSSPRSKNHAKGDEKKGKIRLERYCKSPDGGLINASSQLKSLPDYRNSIYFVEPFYQLMRQTLWAEQMIQNKAKERVKADQFMHVHVIPCKNEALLYKKHPAGKIKIELTWKNHINDQTKYQIISPKKLMKGIDREKYADLFSYLTKRYG